MTASTVHLTKREGGSSGAGFAWTDTLCGIEHGAVWSSDDVAQVDCEACLEAAHAFGDRCWARRVELARAAVAERDAIGAHLNGPGMAKMLADEIDECTAKLRAVREEQDRREREVKP